MIVFTIMLPRSGCDTGLANCSGVSERSRARFHSRNAANTESACSVVYAAEDFAHLSAADRKAILEILRETKPSLPKDW